ncbi:sensor histidine kinase [Bacillus sp. OK048]|uniref:sensor histidine kinase n=1 Tax=Bacillus sp. OK048 TaxID=1882761 RepID=UPI0008800B9A|nr:sensor histidine kinase [Bacillus sp. OK048]SDN57871.1 Signal transduction histidine kinase [Bacillus sp. OK048]
MRLWEFKQAQRKDVPITFYLMRELRLIMLLLIGGSYIFTNEAITYWKIVFVIAVMLGYTLTHFLHFNKRTTKYYLLWTSIDFVVTIAFGIVFPSLTLYQINFGIIGITLLIFTNNRRIILIASLLFAIVWTYLWTLNYLHTGHFRFMDMLINLGFVLNSSFVGIMVGYLFKAREKIAEQYEKLVHSHSELEDTHNQLRSYAKQVEELTATSERNKIAREIHDTVGHTMTALIVQLQAARMLQQSDLKQAGDTLTRCEALARSALQEVRLSVRALRDEGGIHLTLTDTLRTLIKDFSDMTGMVTSLRIQGDLTRISTSLQPMIFRLIQEALTNAKRHGDASEAVVTLQTNDDQIDIMILDNGCGAAEVVPGFGLINMRERLQEHSGSIQFESVEGQGFRVQITIPIQTKTWTYGGAES